MPRGGGVEGAHLRRVLGSKLSPPARGRTGLPSEAILRYHHTQVGTVVRATLFGGAVVCALLSQVMPGPPWILTLVVVILVIAGYLFSSMTIEIDGRMLGWAFGPGVIRKAVPLAEIRRAEVTTTRWYEGWGIHKTRRGWLYNVSGFDAVLVTRTDGTQFLLGTDEPARLRDAIQRVAAA